MDQIVVKGAREHNLRSVDVDIPRDRLVVITGLSGSGKSSLAFDTIYAEGQRRYVESLSAYARQFLEQLGKPDVDSIEGLSPAISIEQKTTSRNPRSTVATVTEIYDYMRLLFARVGRPHCPNCGKPIDRMSVQQIVDQVLAMPEGTKINVLAPIARGRKGEFRKELDKLRRDGYARVRVDGEVIDLSEEIRLDKKFNHEIDVFVDRLIVKESIRRRLTDSVETVLRASGELGRETEQGLVRVEELRDGGESVFHLYSERFGCIDCGISFPEIEPRFFSFNSPHGACETCAGLGTVNYFDEDLIVPDPKLSIREGAVYPWRSTTSVYLHQMIETVADAMGFSLLTPWKDLPKKARDVVLHGSGEREFTFRLDRGRMAHAFTRPFEGLIPNFERRLRETASEDMKEELGKYMTESVCTACGGARLRPEVLAVRVGDHNIHEVASKSVRDAEAFFEALALTDKEMEIARRILKELRERIGFLRAVGLDYLTLDRKSGTLSGGEGQRIRLATQIGSSLMGVLYILDEPSIGLHQRDNARLLAMLMRLRDLGNTVLVVEHDQETIESADWVIDMGPGAGRKGGRVVAAGRPEDLCAHPESLTGLYLSGRRRIEIPARRREPNARALVVKGAAGNNLKKIDATIPLGLFTCVTGVSGSGKSTLVNQTLSRALAQRFFRAREKPLAFASISGLSQIDKVINIDQSPIGRTPRSNPATYTQLFTPIRDLFAQLPESKARGYAPGRFSFNVKGGRCEACQGDGIIKVEMHFLPDIYVVCETCLGKRYNRDTLEVLYKGKSIAEVLDMTVNEACDFFANVPSIAGKLTTLRDVGLGYIHLGQAATTLSGGEAQRVKLAKELSKRSTGRTVYILDEPTTGLHFDDIRKLLSVLNRFADQGNTVIVIEHNLDVIKTADWVIDLGPEGGEGGGRIVAEGPPEAVAANPESFTGRFLAKVLTAGAVSPVCRANGSQAAAPAPKTKAKPKAKTTKPAPKKTPAEKPRKKPAAKKTAKKPARTKTAARRS